jgi:uncharacterized DUF497 family protein
MLISIESECLAQIIPLGERHLRQAVREYAEHYHHEPDRGESIRLISARLATRRERRQDEQES